MTQDTFAIEDIVTQVLSMLRAMNPGEWADVYVWSDGTVSGPKAPDSNKADLKVVSVFTPADVLPDAADVKLSIENGLVESHEPAGNRRT